MIEKIVTCDKCGKKASTKITWSDIGKSLFWLNFDYDFPTEKYPKSFHNVNDKDFCEDCYKIVKEKIRRALND